MILITHDKTNHRSIEEQVQDDSKNTDITEEDDERSINCQVTGTGTNNWNGELGMVYGVWVMGNGKWEMGNGEYPQSQK